jgi:crotonobetainyl-CoA:carnitine CoA-transferase CaiB-like acyl-CoA transferase
VSERRAEGAPGTRSRADHGHGPSGALAGLRVVDISTLFAAPQIGALLADLGADVVKVEPPAGDPLEKIGAQRNGRSLPYVLANRGKRRVVVDVDTDDGRAALHRLAARADVVLSNQPLSLLARWGCTPDELLARNPDVVVVTVSCFGTDGPWGDRPGNGSLAEAFAGLTHLTGEADGPPMLPSVALGDSVVALAGAFGVLAACWHRDARRAPGDPATRVPRGQHVDVSMVEPLVALLGPAVAAWQPGEEPPTRTGSRVPGGVPRNVYRAGDGRFLVLSGTTDAQVARVLAVIDRDTTEDHARYGRSEDRLARADELDGLVADWIAARPRDEAVDAFAAARIPVVPVHDLAELAAHPQVRARGGLATVADPLAGPVTVPGPVVHLQGTPMEQGPPPLEPTPLADVEAQWQATPWEGTLGQQTPGGGA